MSSLSDKISLNVRFILGNTPTLELTVVSTLTGGEQPDFKGYFSIKQPDCITETGNYTTPDVEGSTLVYSKTLRLNSEQSYQKGNYTITLYADHPDYTPGTFTRTFDFTYTPVTQVITESFDVFTPLLKYTDDTVYTQGDYTISAETSLWTTTTVAGSVANGTTSVFDLAITGSYYDSSYNTTYTKSAIYTSDWLSVLQYFNYSKVSYAYKPQSMTTLLTYLGNLKTAKDANSCNALLNDLYEKAATLYQHIRSKVCAGDTTNLKDYFDEFYRLTHNYQSYVYINTNTAIPGYDFTTGCGGGGSTTQVYTFRAAIGVSSFTVSALSGKTLLSAMRSGLVKAITSAATADTEYLQVVGTTVTLPTGDIVNSVTLPDSSVAGELFSFTYN